MAEEYEEVDMGEVGEVDAETNGIEDFLNAVQSKNYTDAEAKFNELIGDKLQDTLDQAKARIAGQIYNDEVEESEEELGEYEFDDEEVED